MRVISGSARGRRLSSVPGDRVRPTADRVKEALFSILLSRYEIADADVLDLFAGTGALGVEALSRGAASATFVEHDPVVVQVLRRNLDVCRLQGRVLAASADKALAQLGREGVRFAGVFLDPPYAGDEAAVCLRTLSVGQLLAPGAWVVVEHDSRKRLPEPSGGLRLILMRRYGTSVLSLFEKDD